MGNKSKFINTWEVMPITHSIWGTGGGNHIIENDDLRVSYQPWDSNPNDTFLETMVSDITGNDEQSPETALYTTKDSKWRILKGDWRKEYDELFPDVEKCIEFYEKMKPKYGFDKWSTD